MLDRLSTRVVTGDALSAGQRAVTLDQIQPGASATVIGVECLEEPTIARRLFDLGFTPGATVEVVRRAPLADPLVLRVAGYELALRRAQARLIGVCTES